VSPAAKPPSGTAPVPAAAPTPAPAAPKPEAAKDRSSAAAYAATIAPGTGQLDVVRPPKSAQQKVVSVESSAATGPAPIMDDGDLTGKTLNNRYVVEGKLGEGGFGAVYKAKQTQMNRQV